MDIYCMWKEHKPLEKTTTIKKKLSFLNTTINMISLIQGILSSLDWMENMLRL